MSDLEDTIRTAAQKAAREEVQRIFASVITFLDGVERGAPYPQTTLLPVTPTEQKPRNRDRTRAEVLAEEKKAIESGKLVPLKAVDNDGRGLDACCSEGEDCCE